MMNVFGIDFGTTNSAVVRYYQDGNGDVHLIHYADSAGRPVPSAVAISREDGKVYVGREAKKTDSDYLKLANIFHQSKEN